MDSRTVDVTRKAAGGEYLAALERLGLRPSALFWAFDRTVDHLVLVLVTPVFDYVGPFELSKVLIEAHKKSGTPEDIDPFLVRMHSPDHAIIREIGRSIPFGASSRDARRAEIDGAVQVKVDAADLEIAPDWVYRFESTKPMSSADAARRWSRFVSNVDRLAA